jgi:HAD superfamily hydrolase (TIGR01549 family)
MIGKFRAVIFDMDGTLRKSWTHGGEMFADRARELGLRVSEDDHHRAVRWDHYYWAESPQLRADMEMFESDMSDEFWLNYARRRLIALGCQPDRAAELAVPVQDHMKTFQRPPDSAMDGIIPVLQELQRRDVILGILSNRENPYDALVEQLGLKGFFAFAIASGVIKVRKPSREAFDYVLQHTKTQPHETVYVGDNFFADVIGARKAGWFPVLYDPRGIFHDPGCDALRSYADLIPLLAGSAENR